MSWEGFNRNNPNRGYGSIHTTTTQTASLSGSLLNTPFDPSGAENNGKKRGGARQQKKMFTCPWEGCGRQYTCPHNVQQHIREKHTNERPYICEVCADDGVEKAFPRPYGLNRHRLQVHNLGPAYTRQNGAVPAAGAQQNGGFQNTGLQNAGYQNGGYQNAGYQNGGYQNGGYQNGGYQNGGFQTGGFQNGNFQHTAPAPAPYWNAPAPVNQYGEYAEMGAMLTQANAQMGSYNNPSFNSNAGGISNNMAAFGAQDQNGFSCGACGVPAASYDAVLQHMHTAHGVAYTSGCTCSICSMVFTTDQEFRNGALRNTDFSQQEQQGPGAGMAPGYFPQQAADNNGGDESNFGIDPALLSYSRSH